MRLLCPMRGKSLLSNNGVDRRVWPTVRLERPLSDKRYRELFTPSPPNGKPRSLAAPGRRTSAAESRNGLRLPGGLRVSVFVSKSAPFPFVFPLKESRGTWRGLSRELFGSSQREASKGAFQTRILVPLLGGCSPFTSLKRQPHPTLRDAIPISGSCASQSR